MSKATTIGSSFLVGLIIGAISGYFAGRPSQPAQTGIYPAAGVQMVGTILEMGGDTAPICGVAALEMDDANGNKLADAAYMPGKAMRYAFSMQGAPANPAVSINAQYVLAPPMKATPTLPATPGDSTTGILVTNFVAGGTFTDTVPSAVPGDGDETTLDVDVVPPADVQAATTEENATDGDLLHGEAKVHITDGTNNWDYTTSHKHVHEGHFTGKKGTAYTVTLPTTTGEGITAAPLQFTLFRHMQNRAHIHVIIQETKP